MLSLEGMSLAIRRRQLRGQKLWQFEVGSKLVSRRQTSIFMWCDCVMDHEREEGLKGKLDVLAWHNDCPLDTEATPPSRQERGMTIPDKFPSSTF